MLDDQINILEVICKPFGGDGLIIQRSLLMLMKPQSKDPVEPVDSRRSIPGCTFAKFGAKIVLDLLPFIFKEVR